MRVLFLFFITVNAFALDFESGDKKVSLVELYTSESCSSCPPAEKWITEFKNSDSLFKSVVPIEFHVTYWNHLSWKDPFSKNEFTLRQRKYNQKLKAGVYTPQVIFNGKDYRSWRGKSPSQLSTSDSNVGNLKVSFNKKDFTLKMNFKPTISNKSKFLCLASITDGGHISKIPSGENRGRTLSHEFVARNIQETEMKKNEEGLYSCELELSKVELGERSSIAAWVSNNDSYKVIQAAGTYLE